MIGLDGRPVMSVAATMTPPLPSSLRYTRTGAESILPRVSGLFVAIGHDPRTELVAGQVDLDRAGYIAVVYPTTATNRLRGGPGRRTLLRRTRPAVV
jgi:hypothetical protein